MRVVVIVAHPDDETVGMGGTILSLASAGHEIQIIVTTSHVRDAAVRKAEISAATAIAGVSAPLYMDVPDGRLEVTEDLEQQLASLIGSSPDAVFTHWGIDVHPDHRNTAALAIGPYLRKGINTEIYAMETCSAGRSSSGIRPQSLAFRPTHFADVTRVVSRKHAMLNCHETQDPDGMWRGMMSMMRNRGEENGVELAEVFCRLTRVGEAPDWLRSIIVPTKWKLPRGIAADFEPAEIGLRS